MYIFLKKSNPGNYYIPIRNFTQTQTKSNLGKDSALSGYFIVNGQKTYFKIIYV